MMESLSLLVFLFYTATAERYRYPSGVLYNPAGNTDPNNAFKLFQAPVTSGSGWILNRFTTVSYDGASIQTSDVALQVLKR